MEICLGLHSWTDEGCLAVMKGRVAAEGLPKPELKAECSATSWMGEFCFLLGEGDEAGVKRRVLCPELDG